MTSLQFESAPDPAAPIDMLEHYFSSHNWAFERAGDEEIVCTVKGSWSEYELRALWREDEGVLQFIALTGISVPEAKASDARANVYEVLGLINEQLWLGHFELWSADGSVLFRHAVLLDGEEDEPALTLSQTEALVDAAIDECERFYPVFQFVLWGGKKPAEALQAALLDTVGEA
ncbi:type III secretion system chaperone family protein [Sandaracinobacteroides saxicola]|uniref:YbjN domain-containing protein n=1 Tax=Sandaracinobacteroides saxicola TaxID=2759707 RepID=UPI001FB18ACB|nr:YbjN domain-containing protein [Sandaracinobacteroides saxicola]